MAHDAGQPADIENYPSQAWFERAVRQLLLIDQPFEPCAREALGREYGFHPEYLGWVYEWMQTNLPDCPAVFEEDGTGGTGAISSLIDNGDGTFTHNNGVGGSVTVDMCACPHPTLVDNGDGTYTHTAGGVVTVIDTNHPHDGSTSTVVDNGDGTFTHDDGAGTIITIDTCACSDRHDHPHNHPHDHPHTHEDGPDGNGWSFEFARKGTFDEDNGWVELRGGSEGLSSVPNVIPFDGRLAVVTAASSIGQTAAGTTWEWRIRVNGSLVAAHPVTGTSGLTSWNVPVSAGDIVDAHARVTDDDDNVNDFLVRAYFEKGTP